MHDCVAGMFPFGLITIGLRKILMADVMRLNLKIRFYIVIFLVRDGIFHKIYKMANLSLLM